MLPDVPDDQLLSELSVIVSTGWDLPARPSRAHDVRHLLLLVPAGDSLTFHQAAQRLLILLDDALLQADDELLVDDNRTGCRILLGTQPTYRSVASPTARRRDAADFLVDDWHDHPPRDPAGTFQRRHQRGALRQVLECLRHAYGRQPDADEPYDVARVSRWYKVDANRQVYEYGENAEYRVREDGLTALELLETEPDPEGLESAEFEVVGVDGEPAVILEGIEPDPTRPGYRRISLRLPRPYDAGELLSISWRERLRFGADAPDWGRYWVSVTVLNDDYELDVRLDFSLCSDVPDLCWWFGAEAITDLNEIGPPSLAQLVDLHQTPHATHAWSPAETERRRLYGFIWVWLDDEPSCERWEAARRRLAADTESAG